MKIDIARQPLVPAFVTLFALAVTAMWGGAGNGVSAGAPETMPLLGGALARFQAAYPVWARLAAGFMILFTGMCTGRIAIRYNCFDLLEDGYGINLRPLSMFAARVYRDDACEHFMPKILDENIYDAVDPGLAAKMHKAIAVIQFKVEGQIIKRHPEYNMEDRLHLTRINFEKGTVTIKGKEYPLTDKKLPTVDPKDPLKLTKEEEELIHNLCMSFKHSVNLQRHIRFVYSHGAMYKCCNSNLLYHGCIPMKENGDFDEIKFNGIIYSGKRMLDYIEDAVKKHLEEKK